MVRIGFDIAGTNFWSQSAAASYIWSNFHLPEDSFFVGASGGTFAALSLALGIAPLHFTAAFEAEADFVWSGRKEEGEAGSASIEEEVRPARHVFRSKTTTRKILDRLLPPDAHLITNGRLGLLTMNFPTRWVRMIVVFPTRDVLIDALVAAVAIPPFTYPSVVRIAGNSFVDSGFGGAKQRHRSFTENTDFYVSITQPLAPIYIPVTASFRSPLLSLPTADQVQRQIENVFSQMPRHFETMASLLVPREVKQVDPYSDEEGLT